MALTTHGWHIARSPEDEGDLPPRARCGGPGLCGLCSSQQSTWQIAAEREGYLASLDDARKHEGILLPRIFQSKPVQVYAIQFVGGPAAGMDLEKWINANQGNATWVNAADPWTSPDDPTVGHEGWPERLSLETADGWKEVPVEWWIVHGTEGEFYPIEDSVFKKKYEELS